MRTSYLSAQYYKWTQCNDIENIWQQYPVCQHESVVLLVKGVRLLLLKQKAKTIKTSIQERRNKTNIPQEVELEVNTLWKLFQFTAKVTAIISNLPTTLYLCMSKVLEGRAQQTVMVYFIYYICMCTEKHVSVLEG